MSGGARRPVAVVLDGAPTPAWQRRALANLASSPSLQVADVRLAGAWRRSLPPRALAALERRTLRLGADALQPGVVDSSAFRSPAGEAPSLLVWLSRQPVPEDRRCDVLYLRHAGCEQPPEQAVCRGLLEGAVCLQSEVLLAGAAGTIVVARTVSALRPFSATLSCDLLLWKLAATVARCARLLPGLDLPAEAPLAANAAPSARTLAMRSVASITRVLATRLLFVRPWSVRVRVRAPEPTNAWSGEEGLVRFRPGHVYADPFLIEHEGSHHLFCEEIPRGGDRGVISHTELPQQGGAAPPPAPVLAQPYHLSYPFVFEHDGELWMIPETSAVRRVELYRAVEFPHSWRRERVLLDDLLAVDATIISHDERLWLFAGVAAPGASSLDELHLFWAASPRGPWHPHPRNPVVSDVRGARPAGAIQRWGSRLVRPAQDGSRRYGWAISFREIDTLSPDDYAEHEVARVEPSRVAEARATHCYASDQRFEAIDLRQRVPRISWLLAGRGARARRGDDS